MSPTLTPHRWPLAGTAAPVSSITAGVPALAARDPLAHVSIASIDGLNPDGAWTEGRTTALAVDLAIDHRHRLATETNTLYRALVDWRADVVVDIAEDRHGAALEIQNGQCVDAIITVRFRPDSGGGAPAWVAALSAEIRGGLED